MTPTDAAATMTTPPAPPAPTAPQPPRAVHGDRLPPLVHVMPWHVLFRSGTQRLSEFLSKVRGEPVIRMRVGPRTYWVCSDAEAARYVLQENPKNYRKSPNYDELRPFLGNGLFTSEGDFWLRQRRLMQPAFHMKQLAGFATGMAAETAAMVARWEPFAASGQSFDVAAEMARLTLTVVGRTLFGVDLADQAGAVGPALTYALKSTDRRMLAAFRVPRHWPTPDNRRFANALTVLDGAVGGIIQKRRAAGLSGEKGDLLSMLLSARDEVTGEGMTDRQVRDEVMTLVLAGHETTSNALAWTWALLSRHPTVERKLHAEVTQVLGGRTPTIEDLPRLKYTAMVVQESMRLYPPVWILERTPLGPDVVAGYNVGVGTLLAISPYTLHRNPAYWDNPEGFDPERFLPEAVAARPRFAYLPFAGGPRVCIGNHFALMEAQIVLAMISQRYSLALVPGARVEPQLMLTLRPEFGVQVVARARPGAPPPETPPETSHLAPSGACP